MIAWLTANWVGVLVALIAIERAVERLFPSVGWLKAADADLTAVAQAAGVKPPTS